MGLLNLTLAQLLAIGLPLAGMLVALYFYDRSRRRVIVSTLRFWPQRPAPPVTRRHKKIQQPWSLLLQLLATLLLLLAIADWRFGVSDSRTRHHVIVLDASSIMAADSGGGSRMAAARQAALRYLRALPKSDFVQLIRADGLATAATAFTPDRDDLAESINATEAGSTALDLADALDLARSSLLLALDAAPDVDLSTLRAAGEVAYIGAGRIEGVSDGRRGLPHLRFIETGGEVDNASIRSFSARRMPEDPSRWEIALELWNESAAPRSLAVEFLFEGRSLGERTLQAPARGAVSLEFRIRTERAGRLQAAVAIEDDLAADNSALLELPAVISEPIFVSSPRRGRLQALLTATPNLRPRYDSAPAGALLLLDSSAGGPADRAIYFNPSAEGSPIPLGEVVRNVAIEWNTAHALGAGLREADVRLGAAHLLQPEPDDIVIASCDDGAVAVARDRAGMRFVVFGFDPLQESLANRLTAPLMFANAVRWFAPEVFRISQFQALAPGTAQFDLRPASREQVRVEAISGAAPAWIFNDGAVRVFSRHPAVALIRTPYEQIRLAMSLPETASEIWLAPTDVLRGIPPAHSALSLSGAPLWPWLALAALLILAADWYLFGRGSREMTPSSGFFSPPPPLDNPSPALRFEQQPAEQLEKEVVR